MLVFFFGLVMFGVLILTREHVFSPKPPHSWLWWEFCSGQRCLHLNFRLKKRIKKRSTSGHLVFSPDIGLLLTSSQESNHKVNPSTHILWDNKRVLGVTTKKILFLCVLRSQMLLQEAEKGGGKTPKSNWWKPVKIWPCCGWYSYPGWSQNTEGFFRHGSQHWLN